MPTFGLYRGNEVKIDFGVLSLVDMRAEDFITVVHAEDAFEVVKGSDGSMTRVATEDTEVTVTLNFVGSSNENAKLSGVHITDRQIAGGAGVATFAMKDMQGSGLLASEKAWIKKMPDVTMGKTPGSTAWVFTMQVLPGQHIVGGNQL